MRPFLTPVTIMAFAVFAVFFAILGFLASIFELCRYWGLVPRYPGDSQVKPFDAVMVALIATLSALVAILLFRFRRRLQRRLRGECVVCGYSMTGNLSGVCPECGTALLLKA
jgi:divalent metal cation (Fe/Co/Zn/Cd) transporter